MAVRHCPQLFAIGCCHFCCQPLPYSRTDTAYGCDQPRKKRKTKPPTLLPRARLVAHTGFEPVIFALRGRCPRPLDECAERANDRNDLSPLAHTILPQRPPSVKANIIRYQSTRPSA